MNNTQLKIKALEIRRDIVDMVWWANKGHIGGALSVTDVLVTLFYNYLNLSPENQNDNTRDRFILSKGHCLEGYLAILADRGFFDKAELRSFCQYGSELMGHPNNHIPGIEMNTGSLGHGLSAASGMALGAKMSELGFNTYVVMGDGELCEGSIWEAAMFAANYKLDNLYAFIDRNRLQISGDTEDVMRLEPLRQKWEAFGFEVESVNGNDIGQICGAIDRLREKTGKPKLVILNTIKGKGVSFMENRVEWHHGGLATDQHALAVLEINTEIERLRV